MVTMTNRILILRDYANMVSHRVQDLGLKVATKILAPTASLSELLDNIAKKGLLYAVIITSQHEVHGSLTLTILYGRNPQGNEWVTILVQLYG